MMPLPRFAGHGMRTCCSPALEQICVTPGLERAALPEFSVLPEFSACHFQVPPTELASSESLAFSKWLCLEESDGVGLSVFLSPDLTMEVI